MQGVGLSRNALLLLSVCLAGWLSLFAAADQGVPSNPFVDVMVSAPPFKPFPTKQPWNTFEIPELPDRFAVDFVWNNRYRGRWIYDYIIRKTRIEYYLSATATVGFLFNYQILKERFMHYETEGNPGGAKCSLFDLKVPYARMFSPRSWRNIDVFDISTEDTDFYEKDRKAAAVMVSGTFDNLALALRCWTNGSVSAVTIGSDHWRFSNFIDWEANDQYAIDTNGDLQFVEPRMPCVYAGELDKEYAQEFQHQIPFTLFKPTQDKALRKAGADAQQAPKAGGKGKAAGKARFRQTHHSFAKPLARWSTGRIRRHRVRPAPGAFALPDQQE